MIVDKNTSALDVAFNLSGSLTGFPAVISQLPVGERIGFDTLPEIWEDVDDIGQTWTPDLQGKDLDFSVPVYNPTAIRKAPFSTDLVTLSPVIAYGNEQLSEIAAVETWTGATHFESGTMYAGTTQIGNFYADMKTVPTDPTVTAFRSKDLMRISSIKSMVDESINVYIYKFIGTTYDVNGTQRLNYGETLSLDSRFQYVVLVSPTVAGQVITLNDIAFEVRPHTLPTGLSVHKVPVGQNIAGCTIQFFNTDNYRPDIASRPTRTLTTSTGYALQDFKIADYTINQLQPDITIFRESLGGWYNIQPKVIENVETLVTSNNLRKQTASAYWGWNYAVLYQPTA